MKKNLKIVILVLSVALLVGAFALAVSAADGNVAKVEGGSEYATLKEALDAVPEGGKITLTDDAALTESYTVTKGFTLDIGDYTLDLVTDAFVMNSAKSVTITGNGTMNLAGTLVKSTATAGVAYTFTVKGVEEGIDIDHIGTGYGVRIVDTKGGENVFENVHIVSNASEEAADKVFFYTYSDSVDATLNFKDMSLYNGGVPAAQNALGFICLDGDAKATINNCNIYCGGTPIRVDTNASRDVNNVVVDVVDSHLEIISRDNDQRSNLIFAGGGNASANNVALTIQFKNSFLGGQSYRGVHAHKVSKDQVHIIFDNSVMANNGANDTVKGSNNDNDTQFTRGAALFFKNGSSIVSANSVGIAESGVINCEVGTRFSNLNATKSGYKW